MRATTLGTPYSVLASSDTTRLVLSSPVAAITTLQRSSEASSSALISHASASSHSALGTLYTLMDLGLLSMSRTSWPFSSSSLAIDLPTAPAPAIATRISAPPALAQPAWRTPPRSAQGHAGQR